MIITGAAGFIGSAVARAVQDRGATIVALVEPGASDRNLDGIDAERAVADIRDGAAVRAACAGARFVFHLAALYRFWARDPRIFYDINVGGTLNVLAAARAAGCERLVFTSTVGVLGLGGKRAGEAADESCYADIAQLYGSYKRSKYAAEHEVLGPPPKDWTCASCCRPFRSGRATPGRRRPAGSCWISSTARCRRSPTPR